jgi:hypothetical protein
MNGNVVTLRLLSVGDMSQAWEVIGSIEKKVLYCFML